MARRKRHHKKHRTRRRRMSGFGASKATSALALIGGAVAGHVVANAINKTTMSDSYKKYVAAGAPIVAGMFLPKFMKGSTGAAIGQGMIAVGGLALVQSTGIIARKPVTVAKRMALAPTTQNTRGTIAGITTRQAAILS